MQRGFNKHQVISCGGIDNLGLKVGERANLELVTRERMWGEIVGVKVGYFLSIWMPVLREKDYKPFLTDYPEVTVRAKCDSCFICGFQTAVTRVQVYPYPILFLAYPKSFEKVNLRKSKRVECFQLVSLINGGSEFQGVFRDISEGGGRVEFTFSKNEDAHSFVENEKIKFNLNIDNPESPIGGTGTIKNVIRSGNKLSLGVKFDNFNGACKSELSRLIEEFDI